MAAAAEIALPAIMDWTSHSASKFLSSMSQLCQHSMRHFRRAAFRGGRGKLVAAKQISHGQTGGQGVVQQWRLVVEELDLTGRFIFDRTATASRPSFAAMPLVSEQGLIKVIQEVSLILTNGLLRPLQLIATHAPPSFAAVPVFSASAATSSAGAVQMAVAAVNDLSSVRSSLPAASSPSVRQLDPIARYAALSGSPPLRQSPASLPQRQQHLRSTLMAWKHIFTPQRRTYKKWICTSGLKSGGQRGSMKGALSRFASMGS